MRGEERELGKLATKYTADKLLDYVHPQDLGIYRYLVNIFLGKNDGHPADTEHLFLECPCAHSCVSPHLLLHVPTLTQEAVSSQKVAKNLKLRSWTLSFGQLHSDT